MAQSARRGGTREAMLEHAARLFAEKGYDASSMREDEARDDEHPPGPRRRDEVEMLSSRNRLCRRSCGCGRRARHR